MTNTPRLLLPEPQAGDPMNTTPPAFATIWSNVDAAIGPTFCTSSTKPASPYACQWIYLTDSNSEQVWDPVASAWVTIKPNPSGILAANTSVNNTPISAANTETQVAAINNLTIEPYRNYKVHVEGIVGYTFTGSSLAFPTMNGQVFLRYANAATVTTSGTNFGSTSADASMPGSGATSNVIAQQMFACDGIYTGGSSTQLSVGWSYNLSGTLNANCSNFFAKNNMIYVERV